MYSRALRFVLEAAFIVAVALVLGFAHARVPWVVGILVGAWILTALAEAIAERSWGESTLPPAYVAPPPALAPARPPPAAAATLVVAPAREAPAAPAPNATADPWPGEQAWGGDAPVLPPAVGPSHDAPDWLRSAEALGVTLVGFEPDQAVEPPREPAPPLEAAPPPPAEEPPQAEPPAPAREPAAALAGAAAAPSGSPRASGRQPLKLRSGQGRPHRRASLPAAEAVETHPSTQDRGRRLGRRWLRRLARRREPERSGGSIRS